MKTLTLYAVRHIPTGHYIPDHKGRRGTYVEPQADVIPRLFKQEYQAKGYLTIWLQGKITVRHNEYGEEDWDTQPIPSRKREEMEVVPVTLSYP